MKSFRQISGERGRGNSPGCGGSRSPVAARGFPLQAGKRALGPMLAVNVVHQQAAGQNARAKNHHGGQNDFP